jgi:glutamate formiminotransferase / 5-formyltetrahydrofolate cyclo-ligase
VSRPTSAVPALSCIANVSEGRDERILGQLSDACGSVLAHLHRDPTHHRSVFTLLGDGVQVEDAARKLTAVAVSTLDIARHAGVHPRFGVVDVVPFVSVDRPTLAGDPGADLGPALQARDRFSAWAGQALGVPSFLYGPLRDGTSRTLPEVRRQAYLELPPDNGPDVAHPGAGSVAVGARGVLVAFNLWLDGVTLERARQIARAIRGPQVRALGFSMAASTSQVSCNLIAPLETGPAQVADQVADLVGRDGAIARAELVGLAPRGVLEQTAPARWTELDLSPERTIESHLGARAPNATL